MVGTLASDSPDAVVTHHLNTFASGVARFNEILAENLGVPLLGLQDPLERLERPLLSFKASELSDPEREGLGDLLERTNWRFQVYLHNWGGSELEKEMVRRSTRVFCGNLEILENIAPEHRKAESVWTPGLLLDSRPYRPAAVSVFSFGMAHKIQTGMFQRLRDLLETSAESYAIYVSSANHETASILDAQSVFNEMHELFPEGNLYFMGNLSDVAIFNALRSTTFFAAFFPGGARANNTSIAAAMEQGAAVITNLDRYSPREFVNGKNLIDIEQISSLPTGEIELARIKLGALETARDRGWTQLTELILRSGHE